MEFYTGIHEPHVMEDVTDEEIVYGPVIHDVEDTKNYQEIMEVIEEETLLENISPGNFDFFFNIIDEICMKYA